jgi:glycosyltransferase involved in cell wall biosynthesis
MIGFLHRELWQRLPYRLRRAALFRASTLAAPRPARGATATPPPIVVGALRTASGLGISARLCLDALRAAGVPAAACDVTQALRQTASLPMPAADPDPPAGQGTLILHVNAPLMGMALLALGRRRVAGRRVIGYWAWELPDVPAEWRLGVKLVHEIWVPSAFTAAAIAPIAGRRPVHVVPHPVALAPVRPRAPRPPGAPFTVLAVLDAASSLARKNPEGMIAAFRKAFGDDPRVRLIVKTQRLATLQEQALRLCALAAVPNIELRDLTLDDSGMEALYAEADVLLSLHRAEGFGLTLAEAMRRGLPVIATGWSGNADFLTEAVGIPIPWRLVPAEDPQRTYHHPGLRWAEPDVEAAAAALRLLRDDPALRARLGAAGAAHAATHWSAAAYAARLRQIGMPA